MHKIGADALLKDHVKRYPLMEIGDAVKLLFQKNLGPGHMLSKEVDYADGILRECEGIGRSHYYIEPLGGFSRFYLKHPPDVFFAKALAKLFVESGDSMTSMSDFLLDLDLLSRMTRAKDLPFDMDRLDVFLNEYKEGNYPIVSHSEFYRENYAPAYRVINSDFAPYIDVLCELERLLAIKEYVKIAIEGGSASGKSTLAKLIKSLYECNVIHTDDFFLPPAMRTENRLSTPGGNIHYERFRQEIGVGLNDKKDLCYHVYDCTNDTLCKRKNITHKKLTIVEGVYSMHPEMGVDYDLTVFCEVDNDTRQRRILKRNGADMSKRFFQEWIPMEDKYFSRYDTKNNCLIKVVT